MGFSDLGKKLARLGQDTKNGVQKMSDSVSISNRISAEKKSLEKLYAAIGEAVYKEAPDSPRSGMEDEYAAVKVAYANIENYTRQLNSVKGIIYCPNCGKPATAGDKFCARCGAKLAPPSDSTGEKIGLDLREAGEEAGKLAAGAVDKTGEFFGGAAAKSKNALNHLAEKTKGLFKETKEKGPHPGEDQAEDSAFSVKDDSREEEKDADFAPADEDAVKPASPAEETDTPPEEADAPAEEADMPPEEADAPAEETEAPAEVQTPPEETGGMPEEEPDIPAEEPEKSQGAPAETDSAQQGQEPHAQNPAQDDQSDLI